MTWRPGVAEKDTDENKQDNEWEIHFWLDTYRLLETDLGAGKGALAQGARKDRELVRPPNRRPASTFPRYQGAYIHTSTNHLSLFASTTYFAGRVLGTRSGKPWARRRCTGWRPRNRPPDGYWGEYTNNGPATGYNYMTMCCVALYYEHSQDPAALEALRRRHRLPQELHLAGRHPGRDDQRPQPSLGRQSVGPFRVHALAGRPPLRCVPGRDSTHATGNRRVIAATSAASRKAPSTITKAPTEAIPQELPRSSLPDEACASRHSQDRAVDGLPFGLIRRADRQPVHPRPPGPRERLPRETRPDRHRGQLEEQTANWPPSRTSGQDRVTTIPSTAGCA